MSEPVETAAAAAEPSVQDALDALTPEKRAEWEATGEGLWPEPGKTTTTAAEKTEAEPATTTTAVETTAAATTTTVPDKSYTAPSPTSKRTQKDQEFINERIRTSVQEATAALQAEIAALKAKVTPDAAATTEPAAAEPIVDPKDPEPQEAQFEDYRAFVKAQARWEFRQARREEAAEAERAQRAHAETSRHTEFQTRAREFIGRRDAFLDANPAKANTVMAFLSNVRANTPIGDVILESEVGPDIADYLAANPAEADRIARLSPVAALRALGKLEARFDPDTTTSASASAGPAAKTVTTAPAPPTTLAARSAAPADPAAAALERGDFRAFEAEENRRALAASR